MLKRIAGVALLLSAVALPVTAQPVDADAVAVRRAVEQFLDDLGNRRLEALPAQFAPKATMVVVRQREGQWSSTHQLADEWLAGLKGQSPGTMFREPLENVTVHVESGQLAFVRADFTVVVDGAVRSHGVDYFTLVKSGATWKILNASYTSLAGAP